MPTVMGIYELPAQAAGVVTKLRGRGFADIERFGYVGIALTVLLEGSFQSLGDC